MEVKIDDVVEVVEPIVIFISVEEPHVLTEEEVEECKKILNGEDSSTLVFVETLQGKNKIITHHKFKRK